MSWKVVLLAAVLGTLIGASGVFWLDHHDPRASAHARIVNAIFDGYDVRQALDE